jgi:GntR family transcriptional repressor for pyruvate dehydrogenase complex
MITKKPDPAKSREVAVRLEEQILKSGMRPGWRLPSEEQLCRTHGVSRTVVREAIQQLKARGLVSSKRGGGTYVAPVDVDGMSRAMLAYASLVEAPAAFEEILDLRAQLEGACAREMTRRRDKDAVARLKARLDALRKARDNAETFAEANLDFHLQPAEECGNTLHLALLRSIARGIAPFARLALLAQERRDRVIANHDALHEAIRTGNVEAAAALATAHALAEKPGLVEARAGSRG